MCLLGLTTSWNYLLSPSVLMPFIEFHRYNTGFLYLDSWKDITGKTYFHCLGTGLFSGYLHALQEMRTLTEDRNGSCMLLSMVLH